VTATVRPARPEDVSEILAMVQELAEYERELPSVVATEESFRRALFGDSPAVFAHVVQHTDENGQDGLVGFALWFLNFSTWLGRHGIWLEDLYVRPEHRGAGYGRLLLRHLAALCVERGYGRLEWWVLDWNDTALGFYESIGAAAMKEWTVHRLTGDALTALAERPSP
jgi:GNAT superfamily N-acetyltransferase